MRIHFERSGGFMGMRLAETVDTAVLPEEEARDLRDMVAAARFFELPTELPAETTAADQYQYRVMIEDAEQQHTVETCETAAPDALRPLLHRLTLLARSQRRRLGQRPE